MLATSLTIAVAAVFLVALVAVLWMTKRSSSGPTPSVPPTKRSATDEVDSPPSLAPPADDEIDDEEAGLQDDPRVLVTGVGMTDVGLRRKLNEDAYVCLPEHDLYAIADGMGAHAAGEVASKLTLEAITDAFERNKFLDPEAPDLPSKRKKRLIQIIERANQIVLAMSEEVEGYRGMGTTVVMVSFSARKRHGFVAHVGDSRCYRIRDGGIKQLTVDHTLGAVGIMGKTSSLLSRAVGIEPNIEVDVTTHRIETGDIFLLCSDGLSRMVDDATICATVVENPDLDLAAKRLIDKAKAAGGKDNVTTVLIRVDAAPEGGDTAAA